MKQSKVPMLITGNKIITNKKLQVQVNVIVPHEA